jgi:hypothetical protein
MEADQSCMALISKRKGLVYKVDGNKFRDRLKKLEEKE